MRGNLIFPKQTKHRIAIAVAIIGGIVWITEVACFWMAVLILKETFWP